MKNGEPNTFELNDKKRQTVDDLKEKLTTVLVQAFQKPKGQLLIQTDTSNKRVGCVLLQEQEKEEFRPVGFGSRTLNDTKTNYDTTQKEFLAVVRSVLMLRPYLKES